MRKPGPSRSAGDAGIDETAEEMRKEFSSIEKEKVDLAANNIGENFKFARRFLASLSPHLPYNPPLNFHRAYLLLSLLQR